MYDLGRIDILSELGRFDNLGTETREQDRGHMMFLPDILGLGLHGTLQSRRVLIMNTIPPQGVGAVSLISDGMAPIPYGESYS